MTVEGLDAPTPSLTDQGQVLVIKELTNPDGGQPRTLAFTDFEFRPLGYSQLLDAVPSQSLTIPIEVTNARIVTTDIEDVDPSQSVSISTTLESHFRSKAIGLVRGGWLPTPLAAMKADAVILPDRNIISDFVGRFDSGRLKGLEPDFLDLLAERSVRINPLLAAIEGNSRSAPEPDAVQAQIEELSAKIQKALPSATLMVGPDSLKGAVGLLNDTSDAFERKQRLLLQLAPMLAAPVSQANVDSRWEQIMTALDTAGVNRNSLLSVALISVLTNPGGSCAARRILKFHPGYNAGDAYNALCDLRSLDILITLFSVFPTEFIQVCTADRSLALFWVGLGASGFQRTGNTTRFELNPHQAVIPQHYLERWREAIS